MSQAAAGPRPEVHVGILPAHSSSTDAERLDAFARRLMDDVRPAIEAATDADWRFDLEESFQLPDDSVRRPSDFLDEASLRMAEGPYDVVLVLTDVGLVSRKQHFRAGLASSVAHVAVVSTRKLLLTPRGRPVRALDDASVRWNAAALVLHLLGHMLGARRAPDANDDHVMAPFEFREERSGPPDFPPALRARLRERVRSLPERVHTGEGLLSTIGFHLSSAARHPDDVLRPLWRNRAPLLPLALPTLATAATLPSLILVFTAEIWDVGLAMPGREAALFATIAILAATWYLTAVQHLFFPRKERRVTTEHLAVVNVSLVLSMLLATIGLFLLVATLMLFIEFFIFPPELISSWPTLEDPDVTLLDRFILAAFISTVSVLTGALGGGLESRAVIRHLALFEDRP